MRRTLIKKRGIPLPSSPLPTPIAIEGALSFTPLPGGTSQSRFVKKIVKTLTPSIIKKEETTKKIFKKKTPPASLSTSRLSILPNDISFMIFMKTDPVEIQRTCKMEEFKRFCNSMVNMEYFVDERIMKPFLLKGGYDKTINRYSFEKWAGEVGNPTLIKIALKTYQEAEEELKELKRQGFKGDNAMLDPFMRSKNRQLVAPYHRFITDKDIQSIMEGLTKGGHTTLLLEFLNNPSYKDNKINYNIIIKKASKYNRVYLLELISPLFLKNVRGNARSTS